MALTTPLLVLITLLALLSGCPTRAQIATPPTSPSSSSPAPAPAPAPHFVNLTSLLSFAGPFHTFLSYLTQTQLIKTFQDQANNTHTGITIFVPKDSAFSSPTTPSLSNLTGDQLKSLLLYHALPKYYTLSDFTSLGDNVGTMAGGGPYAVNVSDASGVVRVESGWTNPKVTSSVVATDPVAVYQIDRVLLPVAIFGPAPPPAPAPAPVPEAPAADLAPAAAPKGSETAEASAACKRVGFGVVRVLVAGVMGFVVL